MNDSVTLLVDAPSLIYRALFSTPDTIRTRAGAPINAAYGFLGMLARLIQDFDPDYIACAADDNWRPEWRVELLPTYKAQRAEAGSQQEQSEELLAPQVPVAYDFLAKCGINVVGHPEFEAEDIIGTLAARAPGTVTIFSGDRDLFQLVEDPKTTVIYPIRGVSKIDVVNERYIEDKYGIPGRAYRDFAVLRGDPSDGLPGVRGIGEKLAADLIVRYGTIDKIIEMAEAGEQGQALAKVKRDLDYVKRSVEVVTIRTDVPLPDIDITRPRELPADEILAEALDFGIQGRVRRLVSALTGSN